MNNAQDWPVPSVKPDLALLNSAVDNQEENAHTETLENDKSIDVIPFAVSVAPAPAPVRGIGRVEWTLAARITVPGATVHSAFPLLGYVLICLSHSN